MRSTQTVTSILAASAVVFVPTVASAAAKGMPQEIVALAKECYPNVSPVTMGSIVAHESTNRRFAINVNGNYRLPRQPATADEAGATIDWLESHGMNFDVGYGQVNSSNFASLGVTGRDLLDPCTNLKAAATVLTGCYARAVKDHGEGQTALLHALSCYNTGSQTRGFSNGYVKAVVAQVRVLQIPALASDAGGAVSRTLPVSDAAAGDGKTTGKATGKKLVEAATTATAAPDPNQGAFAHDDPGAFGSAKPESP
ncbi:hypothetical protein WT34_24340 [Burkholderia stagnalis]|uniref:lytic transglycosylase domain-containing protein n=1 Tax=Burkholderia stagnalis TaxID=1503054 RepID=UPI00076CEB96|nr:lytic transglycosylase domain-containing protein [Burkholderia stagnalis]KVX69108.1 hypothetical protein WT34_24340 [Burkholderia stagnalis]